MKTNSLMSPQPENAPAISSNPYEPPLHPCAKDDPNAPPKRVRCDFGIVIGRWEKLRLVYNGLLVLLVLGTTFVAFPQHAGFPEYWMSIAAGAVAANVCYFLGPLIEGYVTCFGGWHFVLTILLFCAGTLLAAGLAVASIASFVPIM
jgi:hypothetical protein